MGYCKISVFCLLCLATLLLADENAAKERASLLSFMASINMTIEGWNSSGVHVCNWSGIKCNNARTRVVELDLSGRSLHGTISPALANLSSLMVLDLSKNLFQGHIPGELGNLAQLTQLSLSWNFLQGQIPPQLGFLNKLQYLDLGSNKLVGDVPSTLFCNASSSSLQYVDLSNNSLSGKIPLKSECELKELRFLLLWSNRLVGEFPAALSNSSKLEWLDLESNLLSGELPSEMIRKMPQLQFLYLSYNDFVSHDHNTNLEPFLLLWLIHQTFKSWNWQISSLVNLTLLNLSSNFLNGTIPPQLCQMRKLERVFLSNNSLSGEIPSALGDIPHLGLLDLSKNMLSGSIPDSFANLSQLRRLLLYENKLSGTIPPSLGKCVNLEILDLSHNKISGIIPAEVAGLRSLKLYLNLSSNHLDGPLPLELSKMDMVLAIDLSLNNISGTIPPQLANCIALESLNLSDNILEGPLPASIGQLPYLKEIDVSSNRLFGEIPQTFQASSTLKQLNFSFNKFSGNISNKGAFSSLTIDSFLGNIGLCGSIKGMSNCKKKRTTYHLVILPILLSLFATLILCIFGLRTKFTKQLSIFNLNGGDLEDEEKEKEELKFPRVSYRQLIEATGGFSPSSLIGSGRFGHVYKGVLHDNTKIAVKVLVSKTAGAGEFTWSFKRECQVLRRTRHRNLIKILTICSRPDFKALVLPLMANGSLERHLYPSHGLDLIQLVKICSDVAEGVDENNHANDSLSFSSTDGLLCGSVGYIAPGVLLGRASHTCNLFHFDGAAAGITWSAF
ncbi:hypothetical protein LWI29_009933 [Acer saccharum]|uniref:non-specific serine/threonine protein kinase n=1 Tax=Acer saccharum TaxID=4024 RepID=A0AA39RC08_ACESA|nr:hypothetical protein LWI29_009933 [Acer saccharum]